MVGIYDMVARGMEEVIVCRDCGCRSTDDIRGVNAFTHVIRGGGCIRVCRKCADLAKHGQPGLMAVLVKEAQTYAKRVEEARRRLELAPAFQDFQIQACPGRAATADELTAHTLFVETYKREHGLA
jgi:hypothetical protein